MCNNRYKLTLFYTNIKTINTYQSEGLEPLTYNSILEEKKGDKHRLRPFYLGVKLRYAFGM